MFVETSKSKIRAAGILFRTPSGLLLLCQRGTKVSTPLLWGVPGGKVEPDEPPREAAEREITEELGSMPKVCNWTGLVTVQRTPSGYGIFYTYLYEVPENMVTDWKIDISSNNPWGHETNAFKWATKEEALNLIDRKLTVSDIPLIS